MGNYFFETRSQYSRHFEWIQHRHITSWQLKIKMCNFNVQYFNRMKDNLFLRWWYRFGALLCIFPWNPENGKVYVQSIASICVILASIAPAYLEAKSYSNAVDSFIFASLIILSYFVFNLTHFYGLVKERNIWKKHHDLLFCLNTLIDCTVYVSITKILWFVTLWVIMLSLALYSNLRLWSSSSYFSIYLGFYYSTTNVCFLRFFIGNFVNIKNEGRLTLQFDQNFV